MGVLNRIRTVRHGHDHLARVEGHASRVQSDAEYQDEMKQQRSRVPPKRDSVAIWMRKIDRLNALGSNLGHAFQRQFRRTKWSTNDS